MTSSKLSQSVYEKTAPAVPIAWHNKNGKLFKDNFGNPIYKIAIDTPDIQANIGHVECSKCHRVIRYDEHGYAICDECGFIFNSFEKPIPKEPSEIAKIVRRDRLFKFCKA
jgi:hypothetical protein